MDPTTSARSLGSEPSSIPKLDIHNYPNCYLLWCSVSSSMCNSRLCTWREAEFCY